MVPWYKIKNYNIKIKTIILNNHIYGITKAYQETNFEGRAEACGPKGYSPPNFIKIAEAYGAQGIRAQSMNEFEKALKNALNSDVATVIDVPINPDEDVFPFVVPNSALKDMVIA